jgi:hypothetical protein
MHAFGAKKQKVAAVARKAFIVGACVHLHAAFENRKGAEVVGISRNACSRRKKK